MSLLELLASRQEELQDMASKFAAFVAAFLVMQLVVFIFKRRHLHKTFERMQIPGPKPQLIHGHLYETRRQPYVKFAHKMHEKFGKNVGIYLGGDPYLMTKDLDLIQQVFVANSRLFYDRMNFYLNIDPVPDNLICQRGDRWRYMRKLLTPAFSNSKIKSSHFYRDTQQTVSKFMSQLEENSTLVDALPASASDQKGGPQVKRRRETLVEDSYDRMAAVALDVIVKTAFHMDNVISFSGPVSDHSLQKQVLGKGKLYQHGTPPATRGEANDGNKKQQDAFLETVKRACRLAFNPLVELIFCFPFLDVPLTFLCNRLYFGSIIQLLFDRLDYLVRRSDHQQQLEPPTSKTTNSRNAGAVSENLPPPQPDSNNNGNQQQQQRRRIVDSLIEVLRARKITKSEFRGNAFVIVFAGFETTANALTFTLWLLAKHERVQKKLRQELRAQMERLAANSNNNNNSSTSSLADAELAELATGCEYLEMVLNESLRLYPPVPGLSCRQASVECRLANGLTIEKGVNVIPSVFSIHRDKSIWGETANEFQPERFEVLDVNQLNSAMFMPFGLGPRNCIGKAVAMHEMKIVIGRLVLEYSIEFSAGSTPDKLKLCSPINITITNSDKIALKFVKLDLDNDTSMPPRTPTATATCGAPVC